VPRKISADAWFDRRGADEYMVHEQTIRTASDEILTLVLISDPEMLEEQRSLLMRDMRQYGGNIRRDTIRSRDTAQSDEAAIGMITV
jgi:hypothetical protein